MLHTLHNNFYRSYSFPVSKPTPLRHCAVKSCERAALSAPSLIRRTDAWAGIRAQAAAAALGSAAAGPRVHVYGGVDATIIGKHPDIFPGEVFACADVESGGAPSVNGGSHCGNSTEHGIDHFMAKTILLSLQSYDLIFSANVGI